MLAGLENRLKGKEIFKYHCTFTNILSSKYKYKQTKHRKHSKLQFDLI
jgi:hypothetical protein